MLWLSGVVVVAVRILVIWIEVKTRQHNLLNAVFMAATPHLPSSNRIAWLLCLPSVASYYLSCRLLHNAERYSNLQPHP